MLSALQQDAPAHSFMQSRQQIEAAFRRPLADIFEEFDEKPVASASIAQVRLPSCAITQHRNNDEGPATEARHCAFGTIKLNDALLFGALC